MLIIVNKVAQFLQSQGLTLALAESMSCGLASHKLNGVRGTSAFFKGSIICYSPEVKNSLLKVPLTLIDKYTCESQQVTDALAKHLYQVIPADICAAITGLAAGGGSESNAKPVGTVFFSVYYKQRLHSQGKRFTGSPLQIKTKACHAFYSFILKSIQQ